MVEYDERYYDERYAGVLMDSQIYFLLRWRPAGEMGNTCDLANHVHSGCFTINPRDSDEMWSQLVR